MIFSRGPRNRYPQAGAGLILLMLATGCQTGPRFKIHSAFGPGIRFSDLGSVFDWFPAELQRPDVSHAENPDADKLVRELMENHLLGKGYAKAGEKKPDFWIDYRVAKEVRGEPYGDTAFSQYEEGTLILYVIDPATRKWIWRVSATTRLNEAATPVERREKLNAAITQMLKDVPQRNGKTR